jgi:hypothetical protein
VPLDGHRPPFQVRVVLIGKRGEAFLDRYAAVVRFESEPIQLRLYVGQTQFQVTDAQWHGAWRRMIHERHAGWWMVDGGSWFVVRAKPLSYHPPPTNYWIVRSTLACDWPYRAVIVTVAG